MTDKDSVEPDSCNLAGLAEALQILAKYSPDSEYSTEHDILYVGDSKIAVSDPDLKRLDELGFLIDESLECWYIFA